MESVIARNRLGKEETRGPLSRQPWFAVIFQPLVDGTAPVSTVSQMASRFHSKVCVRLSPP